MKTYILSLLMSFVSISAKAAQVVVDDPCGLAPWVDLEISAQGKSVGAATILALEVSGIPYLGSEGGINSINGSVVGNEAMEIVSDTEMRAYGWCYSINDVEPAAMPDKVPVTSERDIVRWYFGFAHFKDGAWLTYCTPTSQSRPAFICD